MKLYENGAYLLNGKEVIIDGPEAQAAVKSKTGMDIDKQTAKQETIAYGILKEHNTSGNMDKLQIKFDKLTSHDITFVGIIQTARASGLEKFPIPYVLTNCHNSLCAVGGTINEDDHMFGLTCAKKCRRSPFSMPSADGDNRQEYKSSGFLLPETVPPGISAGAWAFLPFPAASSPHRKARSPVPVVRRLLSFPAHTGRRKNQSHPHPHRSRSSGNADPASCLGFYRDGTGSKPSRSDLYGFHNAPQPVWL